MAPQETDVIVVVDDEPANLDLIAFLLRSYGYQVWPAADGHQALEAIALHAPLMVLLDLQLPDIDGCTLARRLRDDPATATIGILAVSARVMPGDQELARDAGCDGYVTKPIDIHLLPACVASTMTLARARRVPRN